MRIIKFGQDFLITLILRGGGIGLNYLINLILARFLLANEAGIYFLAFSIVGVVGVITRVGLENAILRFTAVHVQTNNWGILRSLFRRSMILVVAFSVSATVLLFFFSSLLSDNIFYSPSLDMPLKILSISLVPSGITMLYYQQLKGAYHIKEATFLEACSLPFIHFSIVLLWNKYLDIEAFACAYIIASFLTLILSYFLWQRAFPKLPLITNDSFAWRPLFDASQPLLVVALMFIIIDSAEIILLGLLQDSSSVGIYYVANRTAKLISVILVVINTILAPRFAALYATGKKASLEKLVQISVIYSLILIAPFLFIFLFAPDWILSLFGEEFLEGASVLRILAIGQFYNVATGSVGLLLMMCGFEKIMRKSMMIFALCSVVFNVILIPAWGYIGASIASVLTIVLLNTSLLVLVYTKMGIQVLPISYTGFAKL